MTKKEFLEQFQDILMSVEPITEDTLFCNIIEWDSLAMFNMISFFEENFNISISLHELNNMASVQELINKAGSNIQ